MEELADELPSARKDDKWFLDPKIAENEQTVESVYESNPLERGHLVRRLDPAWGITLEQAKVANDDTFHFTNCCPQHEEFNRNQTMWAGLDRATSQELGIRPVAWSTPSAKFIYRKVDEIRRFRPKDDVLQYSANKADHKMWWGRIKMRLAG